MLDPANNSMREIIIVQILISVYETSLIFFKTGLSLWSTQLIVFNVRYLDFCMTFSFVHDENLIKKTNISLIINPNYADMKTACHTESGLNSGILNGLKVQLIIESGHLLDALHRRKKDVRVINKGME